MEPSAPETLRVLELATLENFFLDGYLLANADVARYGPDLAVAHLRDYGIREQRQQVIAEFIARRSIWQAQKFARFRDVLGDGYRHIGRPDAFPVSFSAEHFTIADYPRDSANGYFGPFAMALQQTPNGSFLDIGSGLRDMVYQCCLYVEVYPSLTADVIVSPDCRYPLASASFDGISCCAVLEHVTNPWLVVDEIYRLLKPGGRCYIDWPFLQPIHGYPSHFYNATREGLRNLFADRFRIEQLWTHDRETPDFSIVWIMGRFASYLGEKDLSRFRSLTVDKILDSAPGDSFWRQLIDALPDKAIEELACGNSLIATKL